MRWLALLAAICLLAGCGDNEEGAESAATGQDRQKLREVRVSINDYVGAEHAGLLMAEANGYFAEVGLEVVLDPPANPTWPIRYVLSDLVDSDFSVSHMPQVAIAIENGKPIVAVGSLVSQSNAALMWLKGSGIDRVSDLKGKVIAVPGLPFQVRFLEYLLAQAGLGRDDVKLKYAGFKLKQALSSGKAEAIFGGYPQLEGIELQSQGLKPVISPVEKMGVPGYEELVLIATTDFASKEPQLIRDFLAALSRGTAAAVKSPRAVAREIEHHVEPKPVSSRKARMAQVEATLPLLSGNAEMDPAQAEGLIDWMRSEGMIRKKIPVSALLTNEFLPRPEG